MLLEVRYDSKCSKMFFFVLQIGIPADAPIFKVDQLMRKVEGVKFKKS